MKRIFILMLIVLVCVGGCYKHNFDYDFSLKSPDQCAINKSSGKCATVGESLEMKRVEFVQKLHELKRLTGRPQRVQQRIDSIIVVLPAQPVDGVID